MLSWLQSSTKAQQKCSLDVIGLQKLASQSSWNRCLSQAKCFIGWPSVEVSEYALLRPLAPLLDASADSSYDALNLFKCPRSLIYRFNATVKIILKSAIVSFNLFGSDGAYANLSLVNHDSYLYHSALLKDLDDDGLSVFNRILYMSHHLLCMSPRNGFMYEPSAVAMVGLDVVSSQYALARFLGIVGHFARLVVASDVSTSPIRIVKGKPPRQPRVRRGVT